MKIISWNVNGLRAIYKKGFSDLIKKIDADIIGLQETKFQDSQLTFDFVKPKNYYFFSNSAKKKGYSGVAVFSRKKPLSVESRMGFGRFDEEGRILKLEYPEFILICLYIPHGGRDKENLDYKLQVYWYLLKYLKEIRRKEIILIGDFNIAHREIDLARPKQNQNNIMFTPEERVELDKLIDLGFVDSFRVFHKDGGNYAWWPYFAKARERNLGWRIDYVFISQKLKPELKKAFILSGIKGSDHCPVGIEI